jgi:hypothetical protein
MQLKVQVLRGTMSIPRDRPKRRDGTGPKTHPEEKFFFGGSSSIDRSPIFLPYPVPFLTYAGSPDSIPFRDLPGGPLPSV